MSQNRPHSLRAKIASVVVMALLGAVLALAVTTDSYGLPPWPYWSDMTGYDKLLLVALPCLGALTGALFVWSSMVKPRPIPRQTSTSETEPPRPNSIELPEYTPHGHVDLEAQTSEQPELHISSKVPRDSASENLSASGLDTDSPRAPPPSYTPDNRAQRPSVQIPLPSYTSVADGTSRAFRRD